MNLFSSLRKFFNVLGNDLALARCGSFPGWYTLSHYRGRLQARRRSSHATVSTRLRTAGKPVHLSVFPQHIEAMRGVFAENQYDVSKLWPDFQPRTILDLGANAGMASIYLSARYPEARIACVEPDPRNLPLLERNLAANAIPAKIFPAAIGSTKGELQFRMCDNPTVSSLLTSTIHEYDQIVPVKMMTVSEVLDELGWDRIDLLKVDIEGSEVDLFHDNNQWLERVESIILELHPNTTPEEIGGFLKPYGFVLTQTDCECEPVFSAMRPLPKSSRRN